MWFARKYVTTCSLSFSSITTSSPMNARHPISSRIAAIGTRTFHLLSSQSPTPVAGGGAGAGAGADAAVIGAVGTSVGMLTGKCLGRKTLLT
jgi:hypothetical protein